jgi:hypothetical protein
MTSPKHLWSGDWQRDSEAAARARARRRPFETEPAEPERAEPPAPTVLTPDAPARRRPDPPPPVRARPRPRQPRVRISRAQARLALIITAVVLLVAGGAWGLSALLGSSNGDGIAQAGSPWIGLQMESLANGTVVVSSVTPGSPADVAGLRAGDVITEVQSRPVGAPIDVTEAVDALRAGDTVEIQVVRGSDTYTAQVKLTSRPSSFP